LDVGEKIKILWREKLDFGDMKISLNNGLRLEVPRDSTPIPLPAPLLTAPAAGGSSIYA
jgi:hypothetical protein